MKKILVSFLLVATLIGCSNAQNNSSTDRGTPEVKNITSSELADALLPDNVVLIDVRTQGEIDKGYIKGANKFMDFNGANFYTDIKKLDKSKAYILYCHVGGRSGKAADFMIKNGFTDVTNLQGGIVKYKGDIIK